MQANLPQLVSIKAYNYRPETFRIALKPGETKRKDVQLSLLSLKEYRLEERRKEDLSIVEIQVQNVQAMPVPGDALVALIRQQGIGVAAGNELSSGYSVRGGNYDENLTYVNGMEVYRPFLARSGQQEGLSFVNPDMVESIEFSAGGFEARFGDKMSSVL
ncbi:MAG: Plug domain-containing protein, partial [Bacteroidetes bacterium]|nr:Plug domain-containing protein [Bacteroidota bacterium]